VGFCGFCGCVVPPGCCTKKLLFLVFPPTPLAPRPPPHPPPETHPRGVEKNWLSTPHEKLEKPGKKFPFNGSVFFGPPFGPPRPKPATAFAKPKAPPGSQPAGAPDPALVLNGEIPKLLFHPWNNSPYIRNRVCPGHVQLKLHEECSVAPLRKALHRVDPRVFISFRSPVGAPDALAPAFLLTSKRPGRGAKRNQTPPDECTSPLEQILAPPADGQGQ